MDPMMQVSPSEFEIVARKGDDLERRVQQLEAQLRAIIDVEHNDDGTHGDITAETIELQGASIGVVENLAWARGRWVGFGGGAGTWDIQTNAAKQDWIRVARAGQVCFVQFSISDTVIAVDSFDELWLRLPEFHAIPAVNSGGTAFGPASGVLQWVDADAGTAGMGVIESAADDFSSTVPGTLLILKKVAEDGTSFWPWSISTDLHINGSCFFFLEPNNTASPFFGS